MTDAIAPVTPVQQELTRNIRHNFIFNALDGASFWLGASFMSTTVILPLYASHFTSNPLLIGLIPFLGTAGYLLPQLFVAKFVEQAPQKKKFPVFYGFFLERVPIFLLAPTTYFLANHQPVLALVIFFILLTWHTVGGGACIIGWQDMIAKIFPTEIRGRFFGITNFLGNGSGILGALVVPLLLDRYPFPIGYVIAFSAAAVMVFLSWAFLAQTREPAVKSQKPPISQLDYLRTLPGILRKDRNFRMYLIAQIVFSLSGMATGFLVVYAIQTWKMSDSQASGYTIALQVGLALANLFFGFLADRKGHKLSLEICMLVNILSLVLAYVSPAPLWFYMVFFLRGAVNAATFISSFSIVYEFTGDADRATYIGLANTISGIAGAIAPLIGGWMASVTGYHWLFVLAASIGIASWALLRFTVREPRNKSTSPVPPGEPLPSS